MDNLVNSLVTKTIGLTDQQVVSKLLANPNMNDSQIVQLMKSNGISPSQMSRVANIPEGQISARVAATIPQGSSATLGDTVIVPQYRTTGSGETQEIGALEGFATSKSNGDPNYKAPVGTPMQIYSADGTFTGTVKTKKDQSFFGGLVDALKDPVVLAAIGGAYAGGLFGGAGAGTATGAGSAFEAMNAGAGAFEGGTALNSLAAMTPAELANFEAMNAGATAMTDLGASELANAGSTALSDLGASELANAGASANTIGGTTLANAAGTAAGSTLANAAGTALGTGAGTALGTTLGTGLVLNAAGNLLGNVANQSGIDNAREAITQGGATANTALNKAYADAQGLNTAGRTDIANNYANLNTNLNNTLAGQSSIYNATNTGLANNYANLNTNLNNTINAQAGAYDLANQGIKTNATTQLGLLGSTYQGQKDQAAANAAALNANYGSARGDLYDIYNKQVGIQQPYQNVGQAGSEGLINNQDYLTRQFNVNDLNSNLAPNYAFQLQQGQMANQRAANMGGGSLGGNALRGLQDYTQNYASGAYQNAFNNFNTQRQNIYSTLRGMADIGTTSSGQLASLGNTLGGNLGSLSNTLGGNLTSNTGNLLNAGTAYGSNTAGVTNNLNNVLSSNLGQLQSAYNQYGSNLTSGSTNYAGNMLGNANTMQGAYNQYGSNLLGGSTNFANNLTTNTGTGVNAANVYGLNSANLATGLAGALASNATATGANNATALSNLGNTALLGSMIKAT
jgi:hypothetical protein